MFHARLVLLAMCTACATATEDTGKLRVAVCQIRCIDGDLEGNFDRIEVAMAKAASQGARIACFPETSLLGWVNPQAHHEAGPIPGPTTDRLAGLARKYDLMVAAGLAEKEGDRLYDSAVLIDRKGAVILRHRKLNILTGLMDPPYTAGKVEGISAVETEHGRIGMLICADTFKDELVEAAAKQWPDLLIVPYGWAAPAESWPGHGESLKAFVVNTARRAGCPVVGVDVVGTLNNGPWTGFLYGGQSVVCDHSGTVLAVLGDRKEEVRTVEIAVDRERDRR